MSSLFLLKDLHISSSDHLSQLEALQPRKTKVNLMYHSLQLQTNIFAESFIQTTFSITIESTFENIIEQWGF